MPSPLSGYFYAFIQLPFLECPPFMSTWVFSSRPKKLFLANFNPNTSFKVLCILSELQTVSTELSLLCLSRPIDFLYTTGSHVLKHITNYWRIWCFNIYCYPRIPYRNGHQWKFFSPAALFTQDHCPLTSRNPTPCNSIELIAFWMGRAGLFT